MSYRPNGLGMANAIIPEYHKKLWLSNGCEFRVVVSRKFDPKVTLNLSESFHHHCSQNSEGTKYLQTSGARGFTRVNFNPLGTSG